MSNGFLFAVRTVTSFNWRFNQTTPSSHAPSPIAPERGPDADDDAPNRVPAPVQVAANPTDRMAVRQAAANGLLDPSVVAVAGGRTVQLGSPIPESKDTLRDFLPCVFQVVPAKARAPDPNPNQIILPLLESRRLLRYVHSWLSFIRRTLSPGRSRRVAGDDGGQRAPRTWQTAKEAHNTAGGSLRRRFGELDQQRKACYVLSASGRGARTGGSRGGSGPSRTPGQPAAGTSSGLSFASLSRLYAAAAA